MAIGNTLLLSIAVSWADSYILCIILLPIFGHRPKINLPARKLAFEVRRKFPLVAASPGRPASNSITSTMRSVMCHLDQHPDNLN
jgi:hypothetical protein